MTKRERVTMFRFILLAWISAILLIACSASTIVEPAQPPARPDDAAGVEEIIVTGNESRRSRAGSASAAVQSRTDAMRLLETGRVGDRHRRVPESLAANEELWIISTPAPDKQDARTGDAPGSGAMLANFAGQVDDESGAPTEIPLPLRHTSVDARIDGYVGTVHVRQEFANPFDQKIEAVYQFPLPEKAAISEFLMIIGERRIRGILREKEEAEAIYREARSQGYQASLLIQHRPNIFEQKIANLEPGKSISVDIRYFHTLAYKDGWYSFVFPTVVGPRFNPPGHAGAIVPLARGTQMPGTTRTSIPYLRPNERSGHDISINVAIDAGVVIEELRSTHEIVASRPDENSAAVRLAGKATIPNRDFILDFRVAGSNIKSSLLSYLDPSTQQGYFTMMLYPPSDNRALARQAMEMVFVLDCSGSMNGRPLVQAKNAVAAALDQLQDGDTFQIIRFSDNSSQFGAAPVPATGDNIRRARRYLQSLNGTGGTQMIEGVKAALDFPHDPSRLRFISFMTDGYIGNETEIIAAVHDRIGASRIFSFGVGSSVNHYLLERMAKEGRGVVAYLGPQDSAGEIMGRFFERISHPALTDINIDWGGMSVSDVYPARIPDMFVGRAIVITGKYLGAPDTVRVSGLVSTKEHRFNVSAASSDASNSFIAKIWARQRIAELSDRQAWEGDPHGELANSIRTTALNHQLVSNYTSFVAVDSSRRTAGEYGVTVPQAVPVPDGVRYETTVEQ